MLENILIKSNDIRMLPAILQEIEDALRQNPLVDINEPLIVNVVKMSQEGLTLLIDIFLQTRPWPEFCREKQKIMIEIMWIMQKHNIEFIDDKNQYILTDSSHVNISKNAIKDAT